jgi:hypothetical protein
MRSFIIALVICLFSAVALTGNAGAVGLQAVGKEECVCDPLVARGIVPDTLNKLQLAFVFPEFGVALDRFAVEMKAILGQFGLVNGQQETGEKIARAEPTEKVLDKAKDKEKGAAEVAPKPKKKKKIAKSSTKKSVKKSGKKKRVKVPTRAL